MSAVWPWATLALLGAYHGVNPAMGWLFGVGLALQERDRSAVLRSLLPISLGHAISIAAVVAALGAAQVVIEPRTLQFATAALLVAFGAYRLPRAYQLVPGARFRGPLGMRVGFADLTFWSFLMATAHGAGLMLLPVLFGLAAPGTAHAASSSPHALASWVDGSIAQAVGAVSVHTVAMVAVAGVIALVVYDRVGLAILRRAWVNLDLIWAAALIGAGGVMLVL